MRAEEFWRAFNNRLNDANIRKEAAKKWNYSKDYTEFIIEMMENMIGAKDKGGLGFETSKEYYRIDLTGWTQRRNEIENNIPKNKDYVFQPYCWDLEIAIEHENNDRLWMDEIIKLLHINCPLRVVIGYVPKSIPKEPYLEYVSTAIADSKKDSSMESGDFLLILGDSKVGDDGEKCNYMPYKWDKKNNSFRPLV